MTRLLARNLAALQGSLESIPEELHKDEGRLGHLIDDDWLEKDEEFVEGEYYLEAVDVVNSALEAIATQITQDIQTNTRLDASATTFLQLTMRQSYALYGSESFTQTALESIHENPTWILSDSLESISETLSYIWDGIVKTIKLLAEKIELMVERLIQGMDRIKARAKRVIEEAKELSGRRAGTTMRVTGAYILHHQGSMSAPAVLQGLRNLTATLSESYTAVERVADKYYGEVGSLSDELLKTTQDADIKKAEFDDFHDIASEFTYQSDEFSGGWVFGPKIIEHANRTDATFELTRDNPANLAIEITVATPTAREIDYIATEVMRIATALLGVRTRLRSLRRKHVTCIQRVDRLVKHGDKAYLHRPLAKQYTIQVSRLANKTLAAPLATLNNLSANIARSAIVYAEQALAVIRTTD